MKITTREDGVVIVQLVTAKGQVTIRACDGATVRHVREALYPLNRNTRDAEKVRIALDAAGLLDWRSKPRKPAGSTRTSGLTLRLKEEEKARLAENAAAESETITAYVVKMCCRVDKKSKF